MARESPDADGILPPQVGRDKVLMCPGGRSIGVVRDLAKVQAWVRVPSTAPLRSEFPPFPPKIYSNRARIAAHPQHADFPIGQIVPQIVAVHDVLTPEQRATLAAKAKELRQNHHQHKGGFGGPGE